MKQKLKYKIRDKKEIEVIKAFLYKAIGGDTMHIAVYDTITKKMYIGNISQSSYSKDDFKTENSKIIMAKKERK
jgi:hypothetical protein